MIIRRVFGTGLVVLAIVIASLFGRGRTAMAGPACTPVGGLICQDTTWSATAGPFCATDSIVVGCGATLTIEPGAVVCFPRGLFGLSVGSLAFGEGTLVARGTPDAPIIFTSCEPDAQPGDWVSINFTDDAVDAVFDVDGNYLSGSVLQRVVVEDAGAGGTLGGISGAVMASASSPFIAQSIIRNNLASGIDAQGGSLTPPIRIEGNTISGNTASCGGGIVLSGSDSATLTGNSITGNTASFGGGGGVAIAGGDSVTLMGNAITGNTVIENNSSSEGGGIGLSRSDSVMLIGNTISGNTAPFDGGGIRMIQSRSAIVTGNTINDNTVSDPHGRSKGGGLSIFQSDSLSLTDNTISGNVAATGSGGGLILESCRCSTLTGNIISGNAASFNRGGGVSVGQSISVTLTDNTIISNIAGGGGGVDTSDSNSLTLTGNVIMRNSAFFGGGLLFGPNGMDVVVRDCVLANNTATSVDRAGGICVEGSLRPTLTGTVVLLGNSGFDVANQNSFGPIDNNVLAEGVWWGTRNAVEIEGRIWDFSDDAGRGTVDFDPPAQTGTFDFNGDGEILLDDLPGFINCLSGSGQAVGVSCVIDDLDRDGDVDLFDFATFQTVAHP